MATFKLLSYNAVDALIPGATTGFSALASAAWLNSGITPTVLDNTTGLYLLMDIEIVLSAAVTTGAGSPSIDVYLLPALDGTNYPNPPGTTSALIPSVYLVGSILANASASFTRGVMPSPAVLRPAKYYVALQNNLGVALPTSTTNVLNGYRYGEQSV